MRHLILAATLLLASSTVSAQADDLVFDIPRMDGILIDGDVSDWDNQGFYVGLLADDKRQFKKAADFDGRLWLGWDDKGLLVRAEGRDDQYAEHPEDWSIWAMDAVEMFMAVEPGSKDRYQICVAPGHTEEQPNLRIQYYEFRDTEALRQIEMTGEAAASRSSDTYVLEVRMPWSNLALQPKEGMSVGFQIYLNDQDPDDPSYQPRYTAMWYPGGQSNWNPERMYRVRLTGKPSPPVLSMATVHTFSEVPVAWIEVNAVEDLIGQRVTVSGPALEENAEIELLPFDGRAVARVYLPTKTRNANPDDIALATAGEPVLNVARIEANMPFATLDVEKTETGYAFTPRLEPRGAFPAAKKADVRLYNSQGEHLDRFNVLSGTAFETSLSPGAYLFSISYPGTFGTPITGAFGFAAGFPEEPENRLARLREEVSGVRASVGEDVTKTYCGYWLYELERLEKECAQPEEWAKHEEELLEWLILPRVNPDALCERRGTFEWAYLSEADGSGQPFTLRIPYDLDTSKPMPAYLWLHGSGGGHQDDKQLPGHLGMFPLARGRSQGYGNLACADVFDVYDYVRTRWQLDPDRLKIFGGSMGGSGTSRIASRRPDLFAGACPQCGGSWAPRNNLINVPLYALHGSVDNLAAMAFSKIMTDDLARLGGITIFDVAVNYAHGLEGPPENRANAWLAEQVRNTTPNRISYTAVDGEATGAYGLQIIEWGPEWRPATFEAVRTNDALYLTLDNIRTIEVGMQGIARVSVNKGKYIDVPAHGGNFYVTTGEDVCVTATAPEKPAIPLHAPGGATSLYNGEPLMVVWGTQADEKTNAAMLDVADRLRQTPAPSVRPDDRVGERNFMAYGKLYGKPDTEVTEEDFADYHMVLIGTAKQNAAVARIADGLPLALRNGVLQTNDGVTWPANGLGWSLTHYNPAAPAKRVLWVASEDSAFYAPNMPVLPPWRNEDAMPDLVVSDVKETKFAGIRNFDSRWQWSIPAEEYLTSPFLPEQYCSKDGFARFLAEAVLEETNADAAFAETTMESEEWDYRDSWIPGLARLVDVENRTFYGQWMGSLVLSGGEMAMLRERLPEMREGESTGLEVVMADNAGGGPYEIVMGPWQMGSILNKIFEWNYRAKICDKDQLQILRGALSRLAMP